MQSSTWVKSAREKGFVRGSVGENKLRKKSTTIHTSSSISEPEEYLYNITLEIIFLPNFTVNLMD